MILLLISSVRWYDKDIFALLPKKLVADNVGEEYMHKKTFEEGLMPNEDY